MMRKAVRTMALLLALLMALSLFAACQKQGEGTQTTAGTTAPESQTTVAVTTEAKPEDITITFMTKEFPIVPTTNDQLAYTELGKKTGVHINFMIIPISTYDDKVNLVLSSGEYPDLMLIGDYSKIAKYADDGVWTQLNDLFDKYGQNALKEYGKDPTAIKNMKDDKGRMFAIYQTDWSAMTTCEYINQDLLNKVGMSVPKTIDELYKVLVAFKGLGKDIVPWGHGEYTKLEEHIWEAYGAGSSGWIFQDGKVEYPPYTMKDRVKDVFKFFNKCYKEGLLQKEYYSVADDAKQALVRSGKLGIMNAYPSTEYQKGQSYGVNFVPMVALEGPYGDRITRMNTTIGKPFVIPSKSKYADRIIQMIDFLATDEGKTLMNWGVEGQTYKVVNGKKTLVDEILNGKPDVSNAKRKFGLDPVFIPYFFDIEAFQAVTDPQSVEVLNESMKYVTRREDPFLSATDEEAKLENRIQTDLDKAWSDRYLKFIVGDLDIDKEYDVMLKQMEQMGFDQLLKIKQAQYDRWKNR